jgi:prophage regulatory protein
MSDSILRLPEVRARIGLSRSSIYLKIKHDPEFPKPISLGARAIGFLSSELDDWICKQVEISRKGGK